MKLNWKSLRDVASNVWNKSYIQKNWKKAGVGLLAAGAVYTGFRALSPSRELNLYDMANVDHYVVSSAVYNGTAYNTIGLNHEPGDDVSRFYIGRRSDEKEISNRLLRAGQDHDSKKAVLRQMEEERLVVGVVVNDKNLSQEEYKALAFNLMEKNENSNVRISRNALRSTESLVYFEDTNKDGTKEVVAKDINVIMFYNWQKVHEQTPLGPQYKDVRARGEYIIRSETADRALTKNTRSLIIREGYKAVSDFTKSVDSTRSAADARVKRLMGSYESRVTSEIEKSRDSIVVDVEEAKIFAHDSIWKFADKSVEDYGNSVVESVRKASESSAERMKNDYNESKEVIKK